MPNDWLQNLKENDLVIVSRGNSLYGGDLLARVDRVTERYICVGNARYRKDTGKQAGATGYHVPGLEEATPERKRAVRIQTMRNHLSRTKWHEITDEKVIAAYAAVHGHRQETDAT